MVQYGDLSLAIVALISARASPSVMIASIAWSPSLLPNTGSITRVSGSVLVLLTMERSSPYTRPLKPVLPRSKAASAPELSGRNKYPSSPSRPAPKFGSGEMVVSLTALLCSWISASGTAARIPSSVRVISSGMRNPSRSK